MATTTQRPTASHRRHTHTTICVDPDLVCRFQAGDRAAFGDIYRLTVDLLTRYITVRMHESDRDAVDDLVHDAYCDALANPALIEDDPVGSMLRLAARAATRHQWSTNRYVRAAYTVYEDQHRRADGRTAITRMGRLTFVPALARLTLDQRRAVQLRLLDGYPRDAAGRLMGKTAEAIRSLERRALLQLKRQFPSPPDQLVSATALAAVAAGIPAGQT